MKSFLKFRITHLFAFTIALLPSLTVHAQTESKESDTIQESKTQVSRIVILNPLTKLKDTIEISPEIAGPIEMLAVTEGSRIKKGDILAQIKDDRAVLRLGQARFEHQLVEKQKESDVSIRVAEKTSAVASAEFTRAELANKKNPNTYAVSEIERLKLVYEKSLLEIEKNQHDRSVIDGQLLIEKAKVQLAELEVEQHRITSPVQGMVVRVNKQLGEWIEPGSPLVELVDLEAFRVEGFVSVQDAAKHLYDLPATVSMPFAGQEWKVAGKVAFISPEANPVNSQVRIILEFPFTDDETRRKFRSGLKCDVWIELSPEVQTVEPTQQSKP